MTYVEVLTLLISLLSVVVAFVSLWRTTRLQERMTKAEEAQGRLAERQLSALDEDEQRAGKADVRVRLEPGSGAQRFVIENYGPADATDVQAIVVPISGKNSPIPRSEMEKLPIARLAAGDKRSLLAVLTFGTGSTFDVTLSWTNEDRSPGQRKQQVSV
jgi:hypothetical protein